MPWFSDESPERPPSLLAERLTEGVHEHLGRTNVSDSESQVHPAPPWQRARPRRTSPSAAGWLSLIAGDGEGLAASDSRGTEVSTGMREGDERNRGR